MFSISQAVTSQYADLFFGSEVLRGDNHSAYTLLPWAGYMLWAGASNRIAIARKHTSCDVYAVSVTIQRNSNIRNNSVARPAPRSAQRALLMTQVHPESRYRCGKSI